MPPKTIATPEQVQAELIERKANLNNNVFRKNRRPGINERLGRKQVAEVVPPIKLDFER